MSPVKVVLWLMAAFVVLMGILLITVLHFKPSPIITVTVLSLPNIVCLSLFLFPARKRKVVDEGIIYNDGYVEIYDDFLVVRGFYFGPIGKIKIRFGEIKSMEVMNFKGICWRLQGTVDLKTWFAHDLKRYSKKQNIVVECSRFKCKVGFSVEDFEAVSAIFKDKGLLTEGGNSTVYGKNRPC